MQLTKKAKRVLGGSVQHMSWNVRRASARWMDSGASKAELEYRWSEAPFNRISILNAAANAIGARSYLEIGCFSDASFHAMPILDKVGVDPVAGGTHRMTSDEFFLHNHRYFDLVFVDGLHTHEQAIRDARNALKWLSPSGILVLHDCLPRTWIEQTVPRMSSEWTGDVWKAIFELKTMEHVDTRVVLIDHGCAVVTQRPNTNRMRVPMDDFGSLTFDFYVAHHPKLDLIDMEDALQHLQHLGADQ